MSGAQFMSKNYGCRSAQALKEDNCNVLYGRGNGNGGNCVITHTSVGQRVHGCSQSPHKFVGNDRGRGLHKTEDKGFGPAKHAPWTAG